MYRSKIDFRRILTFLVVCLVFVSNVRNLYYSTTIINFVFTMLWLYLLIRCVNIFFNTYYVIKKDSLYIKFGKRETFLSCFDIVSITEGKYDSSPASLSEKVLLLELTHKRLVAISPLKRKLFIEEILKINENIVVSLKDK